MSRVSEPKPKSFEISKRAVWEAYRRVKANKGAAGVDEQSIEEFERVNGANTRVATFAGWVGRIGDRGLLVSLPRVQGAAGSARSESPRSGRQGRRAVRPSPRARGSAPPGGAGEP